MQSKHITPLPAGEGPGVGLLQQSKHTTPLPAGEGSGVGLCGGGALRGCGVAYSSSVGLISSICSCTILRLNTLSSIVYAMSKLRFDLM